MSAKTAAEIDALAKLAYEAQREVTKQQDPWERLPALSQEGWRAVARALERALSRPGV